MRFALIRHLERSIASAQRQVMAGTQSRSELSRARMWLAAIKGAA